MEDQREIREWNWVGFGYPLRTDNLIIRLWRSSHTESPGRKLSLTRECCREGSSRVLPMYKRWSLREVFCVVVNCR